MTKTRTPGGDAYRHPPGSPFRADYQPQIDWSDLRANAKRANAPNDDQRAGWGNGTIHGQSAKPNPGKAGRIRKPSALG